MLSDSGAVFSSHVVASGDRAPGPRSRHVLVHDRAAGATLLFGGLIWASGNYGSTGAEMLGDTWELKGGSWSEVMTRDSPSKRHRSGVAHHEARRNSVLFGGQNAAGTLLADTWTYADGTWERRPFWAWHRPPGRCAHAMAYDEAIGAVVLFGGIGRRNRALGDTWLFDGDRWQRIRGLGPGPRLFASMTFDPRLGGCILHGGTRDEMGRVRFGDTWLFRDRAWSRLPEEFVTEPRDDHGLAFHRGAGAVVMLEGNSGMQGTLCLTPAGWQSVTTHPKGPRHQCSPMAWDDSLEGLVHHGGETGQAGTQFDATRVLRFHSR